MKHGATKWSLLAMALACAGHAHAATDDLYGTTEPFASEAIYFVLTDRFVNGDPSNDHLITVQWRDQPLNRPEHKLLGVMFETVPVDGDLVITNILFQMNVVERHFPEIKEMPGLFPFFMAENSSP